jgi:hypothetical protein
MNRVDLTNGTVLIGRGIIRQTTDNAVKHVRFPLRPENVTRTWYTARNSIEFKTADGKDIMTITCHGHQADTIMGQLDLGEFESGVSATGGAS